MSKIGTSDISKIMLGSTEVTKAYLGTDIVYGASTPILPSEYQQVEYIQSSGTQYIDTGMQFYSLTDKLELDFVPVKTYADVCAMGAYNSNRYIEIGILGNKLRLDISSSLLLPITAGERYYAVKDGTAWTLDGETVGNGTTTNDGQGVNIYIFGRNFRGSANKLSSTKIYSFKMTRDGSEIINLIPCYRISDNEIGMYDIVTRQFFTNQGSGTFLKGADV